MLSVKEASEMLGLKPATLRNWQARRKNLPFVRCGRAVRIPADAIERFILENTVPAKEQRP
jgi:excisionase family DNA binding protein